MGLKHEEDGRREEKRRGDGCEEGDEWRGESQPSLNGEQMIGWGVGLKVLYPWLPIRMKRKIKN